jgi:3-phenylpropionate/trans-cinnamate dioxygenase ferredoxin subunit
VTPLANLMEGQGRAAEVEGRPIALFLWEGEVFALDNLCPHSGARLALGRVAKGVLSCPLHGARFELASGQCRTPQMGLGCVVTHEVRVSDGYVEVALAAAPMTEPLT